MIVEQLYTKCLAQGAYFIASEGEAVIIDPLRETRPYIELAKENNSKIKYILLTHFHADFVSGHVDLAKATGATIVLGPNAEAAYDFHSAKDGEVFQVGKLSLELLHTPGHTMESSCYLLRDENERPQAIFTGDTLFIGDVGRPDLAAGSELSNEDLAGHLYDSLRSKIIPLPDDIIVYPAHGAGSACGKNMSSETTDTLGNQKKTNYALDTDLSKQDFIKELIAGLALPPNYFAANVAMNKEINSEIDTIVAKGTTALDVGEFEKLAYNENVLVLDTRGVEAFAKATVPGAWFVGLSGDFAPWVGAVIPEIHQKIIFIADEGKEEEVVTRLARVGFDNTLGYLKGGIHTWKQAGKKTIKTQEVTAAEFVQGVMDGSIENTLDVRRPAEYEAGHVNKAIHLPLDTIIKNVDQLDPEKTYHIHCAGGYRSLIYASIARAKGIDNVVNVLGGYGAIKKVEDSNKQPKNQNQK